MTTLFAGLDHLATLRSAGGGRDPDPVVAAALAELAGAHHVLYVSGEESGQQIAMRAKRLGLGSP